MAFSFYSSLKSIPRELREVSTIYRFSWWQRFTQLELPYASIGLVWNSMMSVAGGWFFLMACEMFVLGERDFRLPGLGSYLQTAASEGDTRSIVLGLVAMISVIVLLDQLVWRPVIAWADKFKFEQVEAADAPRSAVLNLLRRSPALGYLGSRLIVPIHYDGCDGCNHKPIGVAEALPLGGSALQTGNVSDLIEVELARRDRKWQRLPSF